MLLYIRTGTRIGTCCGVKATPLETLTEIDEGSVVSSLDESELVETTALSLFFSLNLTLFYKH